MNPVLFSSDSDEWSTPRDFFHGSTANTSSRSTRARPPTMRRARPISRKRTMACSKIGERIGCLQSAVWSSRRRMGVQGLRGSAGGRVRRAARPRPRRHEMVPRLDCQQSRGDVPARSPDVRHRRLLRAVSESARDLSVAIGCDLSPLPQGVRRPQQRGRVLQCVPQALYRSRSVTVRAQRGTAEALRFVRNGETSI